MGHRGELGASTTLHKSLARQKRDARRRRNEEKMWKSKNGPVKTYIDPSIKKD